MPDKDKAKLYDVLSDSASRVNAAEVALARRRQEHAAKVARLVSSKPERVDWYLHPGDLTHAEVMRYAALTQSELHRLMQRHGATARKEKPGAAKRKPKARKRSNRRQRHVTPPEEIGF